MKSIGQYLNTQDRPFVLMLIGPPLSGKSTFIRDTKFPENTVVISRDELLLECAGTDDYVLAWDTADQKEVDRLLREKMESEGKGTNNVIIDMTNVSSKKRKYTLTFFPSHRKVAVVFPILSEEEYERRNDARTLNEKKFVPMGVIRNMIENMTDIAPEENYHRVFTIDQI